MDQTREIREEILSQQQDERKTELISKMATGIVLSCSDREGAVSFAVHLAMKIYEQSKDAVRRETN